MAVIANTHDVTVNSADCIKTMTSWGYDTVHNVCAGTATQVPWGTLDYFGNVSLISLMILLCLLLLGFVSFLAKETFFGY
ncbi:hypothetical protein CN090_04205 [Sinorhizobium meliloti]|uniref:hypothetical protein n=1 Tax=Rhizobium meliloti TaxID=382 RepID=UPI000FD9C925|nr:hypothetical protein [Sinorhizobium meliloti]RVO55127.1 hypothetical protein CN090_04205 [Sinorhizobium meliloti]